MARKKKNRIVTGLKIERYAAEGKSIAHAADGKTIFVTGAVPGDVATVFIHKDKKQFAEAKVMEVTEPALHRVLPFCVHFGICGGCKWQMLPYEYQLRYKQQQVEDQLKRIGAVKLPEIEPIIGCTKQKFYRNKLEFTFSDQAYLTREEIDAAEGGEIERKPALGFHAPGMFDKVVDIDFCHLQEEPTNRIKNFLRELAFKKGYSFYNPRKQEGWLRNLIIRISTTGQVMVNLIVREEREDLYWILEQVLQEVPEISSLNYTINPKVNDTIYDLEVKAYHGKAYIEERLGDFTFKISPKSFFQTNSKQAERLYEVVRDFAGLKGTEIVYDLYCGTGSIGIFVSPRAGKVIGVELVEDAIADAVENAAWNGITNCSFHRGDAAEIINQEFFEKHGRPDLIITDPPRAGMHARLVEHLLKIRAPRVIYVSCNPATQARDLQLLDEAYSVLKVQPVDMFPHTHHIENVVLLGLKE